jgi:hypothetical protein
MKSELVKYRVEGHLLSASPKLSKRRAWNPNEWTYAEARLMPSTRSERAIQRHRQLTAYYQYHIRENPPDLTFYSSFSPPAYTTRLFVELHRITYHQYNHEQHPGDG